MSPGRRRESRKNDRSAKNLSDILYPSLDLHGQTATEASRATRTWLEEMRSMGDPVVRVITGRGMHSAGAPVLPGAIEELLKQLKGTIVQQFEREPGGGAYRIKLRLLPKQTVESTDPRRTIAPAVIRQAEEALADLGIAPTKALLDAEIRRILAERKGESG